MSFDLVDCVGELHFCRLLGLLVTEERIDGLDITEPDVSGGLYS